MHNVLLAVILILFISFSDVKSENNRTFPEGFLFGVSSSAYQVEGAWNKDGKGENIWDHWIHTDPTRIKNNDTADVATDSYHRYVDDALAASDLGATHYRFSISWSRIFPTGNDTSVNVKGIMYYQELIRFIKIRNMIPVATLYYYDLPQPLQDLGGWTNPEMVNYFVEFARVVFQYLPDVEYWITFNNPRAICRLGYGEGVHAPGIALDGTADYLCTYVLLKTHAAVYHLYQEKFPGLNAKVSMAIDIEWSEPAGLTATDAEAADRRNLFEFGIYAHPIFIGNWPQVVIDRVGNRSNHENLKQSRLPAFTREEIDYIKGTADFMAINTYSARLVSDIEEPAYDDPGYLKDMKARAFIPAEWSLGADGNAIAPWGTRNALRWLKSVYDDPEIFITENGVAVERSEQETEEYHDTDRIIFYTGYLLAILDAMYEDNVRVFGYTARSLLDCFEWTDGYSQHFGFFYTKEDYIMRFPKDSVHFYNELTRTLRVPDDLTTTSTSTFPTRTTTPGAASRMDLYPSLVSFVIYLCLVLI